MLDRKICRDDMKYIFGDVLEIKNGKNQKAVENAEGEYPIYGSGGIIGYADDYICNADTVIIGRKGSINNPIYVKEPFWNVDTAFGLEANREILLPKYLFYFCRKYDFEKLNKTVTIPSLTKSDLLKVQIDVPEISDQEHVIKHLEKIEYIIELRQEELTRLDELIKARFVELFGDSENNTRNWPVFKLCELCDVGSSKRIYQEEQTTDGVPFWRISDLVNKMDTGYANSGLYISYEKYNELIDNNQVPVEGDILVTSRGTLGRCYIISGADEFYFQDGMISWLSKYKKGITPLYIKHLFMTPGIIRQIEGMQAGSTVAYLSIAMLKKLDIMLPDSETQNQFGAFVKQVDKSKVAVQKSLDETQILFDSLMQEYFG